MMHTFKDKNVNSIPWKHICINNDITNYII